MSEVGEFVDDRESVLPTGAFTVVGLWATIEVCGCLLSGNIIGIPDNGLGMVLIATELGGVMAALLMMVAWLVLGASPPSNQSSRQRSRTRDFRLAIAISLFVITVVLPFAETGYNRRLLFACLLLFIAGSAFLMLGVRSYLNYRLLLRIDVDNQWRAKSRVSIRGLMLLTGMSAVVLGTCRWLAVEFSSDLMSFGLIGILFAVNWLITATWLLGSRVYFLALAGFLLAEVLGIGAILYSVLAFNSDELSRAIFLLMGMQSHLVLFLGVMRASEFRLVSRLF